MRIIFMGSAELACPTVSSLLSSPHDIVAVVTQPDRPKGRRLQLTPCPAKAHVEDRGVPILTPARVNTPESLDDLRALQPDLIVVVAYGQILKPAILELPTCGCINVHASLLPRYRGAGPIQWAIANGESETGVTIMHMNEKMDEGDIIVQRATPIGPEETAGDLHDRLAVLGAEALMSVLDDILAGAAPRKSQDNALATLAPKLSRADGQVEWTRTARQIHDRVRGFNPWPGAFCGLPARGHLKSGKTLKIHRTRVEDGGDDTPPGTVIDCSEDGPLVATASGAVRLLEIQPEGGRRMDGGAYLCGHGLEIGEQLS